MRLSGVSWRRRLARLRTALRLVRRRRAAARLLAAQTTVEHPSRRSRAYDPLLVANLRRVIGRAGRMRGGERLAMQALAAAFLDCADRGWHCAAFCDDPADPRSGRLELWGAPVAEVGRATGEMRRFARSGEPLKRVPPRRPAAADLTVARITAGSSVAADLPRLLEQLGGLPLLLQPGASVLLKANFNSSCPPPASTDLDLLTAVVALLRESGAGRIALGESSAIALGRTRGVLRRAGVTQWARAQGVALRCFDEEPWQECPVPGRYFREIVIPQCISEFDHIIYLLCAKTHQMAGVSLALKMAVGFMHPAQRLELHRDNLIERIAECSLAVRPDLAILDARQCFVTGGPDTGRVATPGVLLAARRLEPLEEAGLELLEEQGAVGVEHGREQLKRVLSLNCGKSRLSPPL